jgi:hypothetical protein
MKKYLVKTRLDYMYVASKNSVKAAIEESKYSAIDSNLLTSPSKTW